MSGWDWIASHLTDIAAATRDHVVLTIIAVGVGFAISFALALLIHRDRRAYAPVTAVAGLLYTIPSLALFAILVPITGLSVLTAEIGLVSYTLLILVRNIVAGLDAVPPEAREAAAGMGASAPGGALRRGWRAAGRPGARGRGARGGGAARGAPWMVPRAGALDGSRRHRRPTRRARLAQRGRDGPGLPGRPAGRTGSGPHGARRCAGRRRRRHR